MAAARVFLFGSRDVWFVVGLPVFLYGQGWRYMEVAGFIASWTIGYGAGAGGGASGDPAQPRRPVARGAGGAAVGRGADARSRWCWRCCSATAMSARPDLVIVAGLCVFGFAFAVISSLHSYLILAYAGSEKAAEDVGFYYAANAAGRLVGILLSGALTQAGGLAACLWGSAIMLALCLAVTLLLPTQAAPRRMPA